MNNGCRRGRLDNIFNDIAVINGIRRLVNIVGV